MVGNEASEYITDDNDSVESRFSEIQTLSVSRRNIVLKAKRYGRWWCLKGLAPDADTAANRASLYKEFEIMMAVQYDGIVHAFAMENIEGYGRCILMEYADGPTLRQWLSDNPSQAARKRVARSLMQSIGRMHRAGVVHRDIKPDNIIVSSIGDSPVLIDFGLADTTTHTIWKNPAGTRSYMAPEQALAGGTPDTRNDIYSLGLVLREMRLPWLWRPALKQCLRPIDHRWRDTDALSKAITRTRRIAVFMLVAALGGIILTVTVLTTRRIENADLSATMARDLASQATARADSLSEAFDSAQYTSNQQMRGLQAGIVLMNDSLQAERNASRQRNIALSKAIGRGNALIDAVWNRTAMKYLDTVSTEGFVVPDISVSPMQSCMERYIKDIEKDFQGPEITHIKTQLEQRIDQNYKKWKERRYKMISSD